MLSNEQGDVFWRQGPPLGEVITEVIIPLESKQLNSYFWKAANT